MQGRRLAPQTWVKLQSTSITSRVEQEIQAQTVTTSLFLWSPLYINIWDAGRVLVLPGFAYPGSLFKQSESLQEKENKPAQLLQDF